MVPITYEKVKVLSNTALGNDVYRIRLSCNRHYARAVPGQFVMVRSNEQIDPLLPRPFSIHRLIQKQGTVAALELLYKVVGKGTRLLSHLQPGDVLAMTGPLGKGFELPKAVSKAKIVAGGIGVAPMVFLAHTLTEFKPKLSFIEVFIGGRTKSDLLCLQDFAALGLAVHVTTDDGSSGDHCLVSDPLDMAVAKNRPDIIFACGPMAMLACVAGIAEKHNVCCQVSIETMMACGMGACLGCAVAARKHTRRYLHACKDGPVFDTRDLEI
ncbi:MAG: dihydroorotate dehydrogenase electron transfer subunit [Deltaproteobacteria bacterium]|jgi:dihydroorotate dehydrogenase electron transfer subunit|nr:dihydroorotate dehydrogenase electron transfer subunit [Deltaproteobacteria bacterium]